SASRDVDSHAVDLHPLPGTDLAGLARLHDAVHAHRTAGHQGLAGTAAVAQAGELEQLVEFDEIAVELEVESLHGGWAWGVRQRRSARPAPQAAARAAGACSRCAGWRRHGYSLF